MPDISTCPDAVKAPRRDRAATSPLDPGAILKRTIGVPRACVTCGRPTYQREGKQHEQCESCRAAPADNWWARVYGGQRDPPAPRKVRCRICGSETYTGHNVPSEVLACQRCRSGRRPDPPAKARNLNPHEAACLRAFVRARCSNSRDGDLCLCREGPCAVLRGLRCEWFERAVATGAQPIPDDVRRAYLPLHVARVFFSGRRCPVCQEPLPPRKRFCNSCRDRRRRAAKRAARSGGPRGTVKAPRTAFLTPPEGVTSTLGVPGRIPEKCGVNCLPGKGCGA